MKIGKKKIFEKRSCSQNGEIDSKEMPPTGG